MQQGNNQVNFYFYDWNKNIHSYSSFSSFKDIQCMQTPGKKALAS